MVPRLLHVKRLQREKPDPTDVKLIQLLPPCCCLEPWPSALPVDFSSVDSEGVRHRRSLVNPPHKAVGMFPAGDYQKGPLVEDLPSRRRHEGLI